LRSQSQRFCVATPQPCLKYHYIIVTGVLCDAVYNMCVSSFSTLHHSVCSSSVTDTSNVGLCVMEVFKSECANTVMLYRVFLSSLH
jgi:hypothetical protein